MPTKPLSELQAQIGNSVVTVEDFRVESGKVEEFARAVKDDNPIYRDLGTAMEQGYASIPAPLTFTRTSYFPRYRPPSIDENLGFDLGFQSERVLHGEQSYEFERPVLVGDVLSGRTTLIDIYQRKGRRSGTMTFAEYETEYQDENGDLVLTSNQTRIETSRAVKEPQDGDSEKATASELTDRDTEMVLGPGTVQQPSGVHGQQWSGGYSMDDFEPKLIVKNVSRPDFVRYAGASGDFNPIHYDEVYAVSTGNLSVFGQGMLTGGFAAHMVADWFGLKNVSAFGVRFESRLFPGDTVTITGSVTERTKDEVVADIKATADSGERILSGSATRTL